MAAAASGSSRKNINGLVRRWLQDYKVWAAEATEALIDPLFSHQPSLA
jgi:hypothetical protein